MTLKGLFEVNYKDELLDTGVWVIYNIYSPYSDLIYIGRTKNCKKRKKEHQNALSKKLISENKSLQILYDYVGKENIKYKIVDILYSRKKFSF